MLIFSLFLRFYNYKGEKSADWNLKMNKIKT